MSQKLRIPSPVGTAVYPWLDQPDTRFDVDGVYQVILRVRSDDPKLDEFRKTMESLLDEAMTKFRAQNKGKKLKKHPIKITPAIDRDTEEVLTDSDGVELVDMHFKIPAVFRSKSGQEFRTKILKVDAKRKPLGENMPIGAGSKIRVSVEPREWCVKGEVGVTMRPRGVQVLHLEKPANSAEGMGFEEEEGFEAADTDGFDGESADY